MLSPLAFLPLGTSSGRCSAGTRWGSCGSPETGYCTGTWRSSRCPWRRPPGRRDRSHRTSVCSGMPCASPARPFQHSRRLRHRRNGGSTWIVLQAAPFRPPAVRSVTSCGTTGRSHRSGRPRPVPRSYPRSDRHTPWARGTVTSGRATSCSARETGRCSPASAWSPRTTAGRWREHRSGRPATWLPSGQAGSRSPSPPTCGRWAPSCTQQSKDGRRSTGTAGRRCSPVVSGYPDLPHGAGPLWPVISGLLGKDAGARPDAVGADWLLRRVAGGRDAAGPLPHGRTRVTAGCQAPA